jgi:hypothetical protein
LLGSTGKHIFILLYAWYSAHTKIRIVLTVLAWQVLMHVLGLLKVALIVNQRSDWRRVNLHMVLGALNALNSSFVRGTIVTKGVVSSQPESSSMTENPRHNDTIIDETRTRQSRARPSQSMHINRRSGQPVDRLPHFRPLNANYPKHRCLVVSSGFRLRFQKAVNGNRQRNSAGNVRKTEMTGNT